MMFLVDSNVLIEAKNRYYAFDIAPGFWRWLDIAHGKGRACSNCSVEMTNSPAGCRVIVVSSFLLMKGQYGFSRGWPHGLNLSASPKKR